MGCFQVVDGARADNDEQAVILAVKNVAYNLTSLADGFAGFVGERNFSFSFSGVISGILEETFRSLIGKSAMGDYSRDDVIALKTIKGI